MFFKSKAELKKEILDLKLKLEIWKLKDKVYNKCSHIGCCLCEHGLILENNGNMEDGEFKKGGEGMDENKREQFICYLEFDDEELQDIRQQMEQAIDTFNRCVSRLERLGIAKVQRKEKTANGK